MIDSRTVMCAVGVAWLLALAPLPALAQAGRSQVQEGNRLYEQGLFEEAHQRYLQGLAEAPESGVLRFNDGNALYRSDDYRRAMEAYQRAIETGDPALASSAWYNLGNALYRQQQLQESLEAYKQALRLAPSDVNAKHNLERVLQQMQQQEQQQDGEQQQDEQDQQQQDQPQGDEPQDQQQDQPQDGEQPQGQGSPERTPGQMTPEDAERLLEAVQEDPNGMNRPTVPATGARPRRPW